MAFDVKFSKIFWTFEAKKRRNRQKNSFDEISFRSIVSTFIKAVSIGTQNHFEI